MIYHLYWLCMLYPFMAMKAYACTTHEAKPIMDDTYRPSKIHNYGSVIE